MNDISSTAKTFSPSRMEAYREERSLTRRALSDAINVTEQTLYSWATGRTIPRADQVARLAVGLGVSIDDLFQDAAEAAS